MFLPDDDYTSRQAFLSEPDEPKQTNKLRLFKGLGNLSEFAAYFSGGLLLAILCRLIPKLLVAYIVIKLAAISYLWLSHSESEPHIKKSLRLTGLAIALGSIAGFWDGWVLFFTTISVQQWIAVAAVAVAAFWVLIEVLKYARGQ
jgi:hypothetical protein